MANKILNEESGGIPEVSKEDVSALHSSRQDVPKEKTDPDEINEAPDELSSVSNEGRVEAGRLEPKEKDKIRDKKWRGFGHRYSEWIEKHSLLILIITWIVRVLCGSLFIFSGFVKAIDPWGTLFKMEEYLNVFGIPLPFAILRLGVFGLCAIEFIVGSFLLMGCFRKSCPIFACIIMAFMLPLTLWIAKENPVADCGCFGDAIIISNWATFWKNIVLTLCIIWLIRFNTKVGCLILPAFQWLAVLASGIFILLIELIGFFEQPLLDFRDYKEGTYLFAGEATDYEQGIDVYDIESLDDMNEEAERTEGEELVVMIPKVSMVSPAMTWKLNSLYQWAMQNDVKMVGVVSGSNEEIKEWEDLSMASYPIYLADDTDIKEVVRGNPGIVFLKDGKIEWKSTLNAIDIEDFLGSDMSHDASGFGVDNSKVLRNLIIIYLIVIAFLILISLTPRLARLLTRGGLATRRGIRQH